jgi:hypothetical protein
MFFIFSVFRKVIMERKVNFRYIRQNRGKNRGQLIGCLAVDRVTKEIGWSYCTSTSPDQFRKETARKIAVDRIGVTNEVIGVEDHKKTMPDRVRQEIEATRNWLNARKVELA